MQTSSLWTPVLGLVLIHQGVTFKQVICCIGSFIGIILIVDPGFVGLPSTAIVVLENQTEKTANIRYLLGCFIGLLGGCLIAWKRIITIKGKDEIHALHNLFYFQLGGNMFAGIINVGLGRNNALTYNDAPHLFFITVGGLIAHSS